VSVNVSGRQFVEGDLEGDVLRALEDNVLAADLLELELTESSLMANTDRTISILNNLKQQGVSVSVDDFGTGYSSLAYLRRFPIDKLKIDIAFIRDITTNRDDAAIALTIIRMAHSLRLQVVAEGVETASQLAYLRRHRCDEIQGYFYSKPLPAAEIAQLLIAKKPLATIKFELAMEQLRNPGRTLLLVDDEADILSSLKRLLRPLAYNIITANSGEQGLQILTEQHVDVIVSDQRMPGMSGVAFLCLVKERYPDIVRMVLSGYADLQSVTDAVNEGAVYKFMTKPWDDEQLVGNIEDAFQHKGMADENTRLSRELQISNKDLALVTRQLQKITLQAVNALPLAGSVQ
jgi:CheY-like chemotaxis protein